MIEKITSQDVDKIFEAEDITKANNHIIITDRPANSVDTTFYNGIENLTETRFMETTYSTTDIDEMEDDNSGFILVPLLVLLGIFVLSALVYLMARNRRRIAHIYCKRRENAPTYTVEDSGSDLDENRAEVFDDDPTECLLKGKLHIDTNSYSSCQTTKVIVSGKELYA